MSLYEMPCVVGRSGNEDTALIYEYGNTAYYCVQDSCNVNRCYISDLEAATTDGVLDVEEIYDIDTYSSLDPITSLNELEEFVDR
jgi:hypothetical protein